MTDMVSRRRRSQIMGRIKATDTLPELMVRRVLQRMRYRLQLHVPGLPGKPDIVLPKHKIIVLVHGCFWHGHSCKDGRRPKSNIEYWNRKLSGNQARDKENGRLLRKAGWKTVVIWACQCQEGERVKRILQKAIGR